MNDYQTPSQILENNPGLKQHWTPQQIGWLYSLGLVRGYKTRKQTVVNVEETLKIFDIRIKP